MESGGGGGHPVDHGGRGSGVAVHAGNLSKCRLKPPPQSDKISFMKTPSSGGGWQAIWYTLRTARKVGILNLWRAMRTKNTCKTCALGMGGQQGGMRNEKGHFPEFCKKSLQAMAADMQGKIEERFFEEYSLDQLRGFSPREMEMMGRLTWPMYAAAGDTHYRPIL